MCSRTVLVTYDKLAEWDVMAPHKAVLEHVRRQLIASSDVVCGLSEGSIDDVPDAAYVGHGVDHHWHDPAVDALLEPAELAAIPRPRAVYVGALSMRLDVEVVRALAASGVEVVLIGMGPTPQLLELVAANPHVHFLGERLPDQTAASLLHCDVGIVPHTDEPFTYSMEPHKAYNYAAAGLPTVTLNTAHAPALGPFLNATRDHDAFVDGVRARDRPRTPVLRPARDRALVHLGPRRHPSARRGERQRRTRRLMSTSFPLVSAVVTAYNYERYLGDALDSALAQDYAADRLEVVVVDDGSTDGTPDVARRYAAEHPERIRYIRQDNAGLAAATTRGLHEARGDLITLLDADDAWVTSRTRLLVDALGRNPRAGLVYGDMEVIDGDGRTLARSWLAEAAQTPFRGRVAAHLLRSNFVIAPSLMFRSRFRDRVCPIPSFFPAQDWYIAARIADVAEVDFVPAVVARYRRHGANMSHGKDTQADIAKLFRRDLGMRRWMLANLRSSERPSRISPTPMSISARRSCSWRVRRRCARRVSSR